mmetsp:Transcript_35161/g.98726  ORF Transcript_35161/g.98726 Transcript_35161/m.98726 type:complete len:227 (+) Transcript_35161:1-681(+)
MSCGAWMSIPACDARDCQGTSTVPNAPPRAGLSAAKGKMNLLFSPLSSFMPSSPHCIRTGSLSRESHSPRARFLACSSSSTRAMFAPSEAARSCCCMAMKARSRSLSATTLWSKCPWPTWPIIWEIVVASGTSGGKALTYACFASSRVGATPSPAPFCAASATKGPALPGPMVGCRMRSLLATTESSSHVASMLHSSRGECRATSFRCRSVGSTPSRSKYCVVYIS